MAVRTYTEEQKNIQNKIHKVNMIARRNITLTGITDVMSFDANEILLETSIGVLMIRGEQLHINRLNLDDGEVDIDGHVDGMIYSDTDKKRKNGESVLKRLFS